MREKREIKRKNKVIGMNDTLQDIKEKALDNHIPILMDDTLEVIIQYLKEEKPQKLLEIGTATRIFGNLFCDEYGKYQ